MKVNDVLGENDELKVWRKRACALTRDLFESMNKQPFYSHADK